MHKAITQIKNKIQKWIDIIYTKDLRGAHLHDDLLRKLRGYGDFDNSSIGSSVISAEIDSIRNGLFRYGLEPSELFSFEYEKKDEVKAKKLETLFFSTLHRESIFGDEDIVDWFRNVFFDLLYSGKSFHFFEFIKKDKIYYPSNFYRLAPETIFKIGSVFWQFYNPINLLRQYPYSYKIRTFKEEQLVQFQLNKKTINTKLATVLAKKSDSYFEDGQLQMYSRIHESDYRLNVQIAKHMNLENSKNMFEIKRLMIDKLLNHADTMFISQMSNFYRVYTIARHLKTLNKVRASLIADFNKYVSNKVVKLNKLSKFELRIKSSIYLSDIELDEIVEKFSRNERNYDDTLGDLLKGF